MPKPTAKLPLAKHKYTYAALAWAGLILFLLLTPAKEYDYPLVPLGTDKLVHLALFFVLGWLALRPVSGRQQLLVLALAVGYGGLTELLQLLVPGRSTDWFDWIADTVGCALAWLWYRWRAGWA